MPAGVRVAHEARGLGAVGAKEGAALVGVEVDGSGWGWRQTGSWQPPAAAGVGGRDVEVASTKGPLPVFDVQLTEAVCNVLAQTQYPGLSGSELRSALRVVNIDALDDGTNKRTQLLTTLHNAQVKRRRGDTLVLFINAAMSPSRYVQDHGRFDQLRGELNEVLALYGLRVNEKGQVARGAQATTLSEAAQLAGELVSELRRRNCHPALLTYCNEELVRKSLFHAVSEASKSIPDRLRRHTGFGLDGDELYSEVFGSRTSSPRILINAFGTESEKSEHRGFKNLLTGIHGHYRNPRAHSTRHGSTESRDDFYDAFALFSYVHRRLDGAGVAA